MVLQANGKQALIARCIAWSDKSNLTGAPICGELLGAGELFCAKDWALIPHGLRQAILQEQRRLREMRIRTPSHEYQELIRLAVKQNLDARCAVDPGLAKRVVDFAEQLKAAQSAASAGLSVPDGERFGIPEKKP